MPWITEDTQWTTPPGIGGSFWSYSGNYVKLAPLGTSYSYVTHIPMTMNCISGTQKLGIQIKDKTEDDPKPGCFETDIWEYFQYNVNRGSFTQVKGYWRSPEPRGRARMSLLSKGIKR